MLLLQDCNRGLSIWFSSRVDARYQFRKNFMTPKPRIYKNANVFEDCFIWSCVGAGISAVGKTHTQAYNLWKYWYDHKQIPQLRHYPS